MFVSLLVRKNKMDKAGCILWFHIGFMSIQPIHLVFKKMWQRFDNFFFTRTDCLQYRKYEYGACTGSLKSLKEYSEQLKDMVTFYLGCSFSFEKAVQKAGIPIRNVEQKCNVSMYKVSICTHTHSLCCNFACEFCPYSH